MSCERGIVLCGRNTELYAENSFTARKEYKKRMPDHVAPEGSAGAFPIMTVSADKIEPDGLGYVIQERVHLESTRDPGSN